MGKRFVQAVGLLAMLWAGVASAELVAPLTVGGTEVRVGLDDDYRPTSTGAPALHAMSEAALPATHRLVEGFVSEGDLKRALIGQRPAKVLYQVQVMRDAEHLVLSDADWAQARPLIAKGLGAVDFETLTRSMEQATNERMSRAAGFDVDLSFGELGAPVVYGQDPASLRFVMLIPVNGEVAGQPHAFKLECAGAVVRVAGKLVFLYAVRDHTGERDSGLIRAALDRFVERTVALNAAPPAQG